MTEAAPGVLHGSDKRSVEGFIRLQADAQQPVRKRLLHQGQAISLFAMRQHVIDSDVAWIDLRLEEGQQGLKVAAGKNRSRLLVIPAQH